MNIAYGDDHYDDPQPEVTFGQFSESQLPTGYGPKDPNEVSIFEVTPIFFHRR